MHLILMSRGINQSFELWKKFMETRMFYFEQHKLLKDEKTGEWLRNEDGTIKRGPKMVTRVQGALRPIQLFEYVFPGPSLPNVLAMMGMNKLDYNTIRPEVKNYSWILRKMMGLKKIELPEEIKKMENWEITQEYVPMDGMAVYPIGIREDPIGDLFIPNGDGYYQEML